MAEGHMLFFTLLLILFPIHATGAPLSFSDQTAGFTLHYRDLSSNKPITSLFVMPGERISFHVTTPDDQPVHVNETGLADTPVYPVRRNYWEINAPQNPGIYTYILRDRHGSTKYLQLFVKVSRENKQNEYLNGYRIGLYPREPLAGQPAYNPPDGFIEVTRWNRHTRVSPHFTLEQFLCKQASGWPKYVVLDERLILKLEILLEEINAIGINVPTLSIMSGYRTPWYNAAIGNGRYSRHIYGDAADVYIDLNGNGWMEDLNSDGKIDKKDAAILYQIINERFGPGRQSRFMGGLSLYPERSWRTPFIHLDARGTAARW
jgi:hypothetical protein